MKRSVYEIYEQALKALYAKKYEKAIELFAGLEKEFPSEIEVLERARAFLKVCSKRSGSTAHADENHSAEKFFNLGVFHHNNQSYKQALDFYSEAMRLATNNTDHIFYAMAATETRLGNTEKAVELLRKAIDLNRQNRFFAQNDPDFEALIKDEAAAKALRA